MDKKFYISTAITYTSSNPHIGNVYEAILADSIARYKRLEGFDVYFQTGTDEHGQKIEEKAKELGISPKENVDNVSNVIKNIYKEVGISYNKFIRTTDEDHKKIVQDIFTKLYNQGDIYKGKYEGMYCVPCESFFTDSQINGDCCPDCGAKLKKTSEEAYFMKMDKYQDRLIQHIKDNPEFIQPESRKNEMVNNFLKDRIPDLCVSRSSFKWGIPVPFDQNHVIYVWIDALSNYITGLNYDVNSNEKSEKFNKYWPCDIHLIGKDILRFHTIYWPILLMALGIELPKQIFGHPWILAGIDKMSKSKNNVIYTEDLIKFFGSDAVRYYVLSEIPFASDGSITYELVIERINSDLCNTLGNLVNRTISMINKYFDGFVKNTECFGKYDDELILACNDCIKEVKTSMDKLKVSDALSSIFKLLRRANKYIDETEPWVLGRDESNFERLNTVLFNLMECIRISGVLLQPYIPETSKKIFDLIKCHTKCFGTITEFGGYKQEDKLENPIPLFMRIDAKEKMKEINDFLDSKNTNAKKEEEIDNSISINDFSKIEIRVGKIIDSKKHEQADKLLVNKVDLGKYGIKQIVSGIADKYKPEDIIGKKVLVINNLKKVELRGVLSEGMILVGSNKKIMEIIEVNNLECGDIVK